MAYLQPVAGSVGLQLLLTPGASSSIASAACLAVGAALPVYKSFKSIEQRSSKDDKDWLAYWSVYGTFTVLEAYSTPVTRLPLYYHAKLVFLLWLQLPHYKGAKKLYDGYMRPFLSKHAPEIDEVLGKVYGGLLSFVTRHQDDINGAFRRLGDLLGRALGRS